MAKKTPPAPGDPNPTGGSNAVKITFTKFRETKGSIRYEEDVPQGGEAKVGALYIRKSSGIDADRIQATIQPL